MTGHARRPLPTEAPDRRVEITLSEARALPGLWGRMAVAHLRVHGWYGCTVLHRDGSEVRTLYVLRDEVS